MRTTPRVLLTLALLLTALVVQLGFASRLHLPGATPDVVLVTLVALAMRNGSLHGCVAGFLTGLSLDLAPPSDHAVGRWALVLCLVGYLAGLFDDGVDRSALFPVGVVASASVLTTLAYSALGAVIGEPGATWSMVARVLPWAVIYDVVLTPFVFLVVAGLATRVAPDPLRRRSGVR